MQRGRALPATARRSRTLIFAPSGKNANKSPSPIYHILTGRSERMSFFFWSKVGLERPTPVQTLVEKLKASEQFLARMLQSTVPGPLHFLSVLNERSRKSVIVPLISSAAQILKAKRLPYLLPSNRKYCFREFLIINLRRVLSHSD